MVVSISFFFLSGLSVQIWSHNRSGGMVESRLEAWSHSSQIWRHQLWTSKDDRELQIWRRPLPETTTTTANFQIWSSSMAVSLDGSAHSSWATGQIGSLHLLAIHWPQIWSSASSFSILLRLRLPLRVCLSSTSSSSV